MVVGLVYSYQGDTDLEVKLELQSSRPVLILKHKGGETRVRSTRTLAQDDYTPIYVTVSSSLGRYLCVSFVNMYEVIIWGQVVQIHFYNQ